MDIWFEVSLTSGIIEKVEVEKYTAKSVWVKKGFKYVRRFLRSDHYTEFHPTFEQAYTAARVALLQKIAEAENTFNKTKTRLLRLDGISEVSLDDPPKYDQPLIGIKV